ncbi:uncharacterized protein wu:fa19b12 [Anoplopoma fimbria]|uniref:uncharacterized protein wu:fa19b12 n=1 Tax=Anoplopoma fimbria TaxID=229290 RepID=UPI0023EC54E3|nr:uncharacterized protein wu:fa19b12 [Anoplopoma fimbria]
MAKRLAEETLLHGSPSKRCYRSLSSVELQLESMAETGGVSPPSLLGLMGSRCRKRPHTFGDPEKQEQEEEEEGAPLSCKPAHCDTRKHAADMTALQTAGSLQGRRGSSTSSKKRPRDDCAGLETAIPKANHEADEDHDTEDCTFNSYQFWRVPLPELDLSLLDDANHSQSKDEPKVKGSYSDAMET